MTTAPMTTMVSGTTLAAVAAVIGDTARANMLVALMGGRALTAGELAWHAGVSPQTTSGHLTRLRDAGLIAQIRQGRHRYHRLAGPEVAQAIEGLMALAAVGPPRHRPVGPRDAALRAARTCYDHLAGRLGTGLADALAAAGHVVPGDGVAHVSDAGRRFLADALAIDLPAIGSPAESGRRPLCRTCLDWSERRPHLAGRLGAALLDRSLERGWILRCRDSRAVTVTAAGERAYAELFGLAPQG
ncbi:ArsR/SmtB family transcription factor [Azospirillum halopraeferens]|uniref:ArsR/SmtB family transcription factor n=1 Tax=Azospirillum halopraeferens TaxID=34010 RepID=UPI001FE15D6D|nr:helix-turn-helix domain-containing protein [Azospirillum halopraeferens]